MGVPVNVVINRVSLIRGSLKNGELAACCLNFDGFREKRH